MLALLNQLYSDQAGFVVSAELVLIATIATLSMIVGLSEVANNISQELEDVGSAFGAVQQTYDISGLGSAQGSRDGSGLQSVSL